MSTPLHYRSVVDLSRMVHRRELSPVELLDHYLSRANELDPDLNAFRLIPGNRATARALSNGPHPLLPPAGAL